MRRRQRERGGLVRRLLRARRAARAAAIKRFRSRLGVGLRNRPGPGSPSVLHAFATGDERVRGGKAGEAGPGAAAAVRGTAANGYVVLYTNPRGSTGFGQKFVNEISHDWGGKVFVDLMKGLDHVQAMPYVDAKRTAAAGASFGGYMVNWFQALFPKAVFHCFIHSWKGLAAVAWTARR